MTKSLKILVLGSAVALLAAGCSSQPQNSNQSLDQNQNQMAPANSSSTMTGMPGMAPGGMASSTRGGMGGMMRNLPAGSKPFFGTIASVSGSQLTISGRSRMSSSTVSTIVNVSSSTQYQGGSQTDLTTGARVAGFGTANSDGSINAQSLQINPTFPGRGQGGGGGGRYPGNGGTPPSQPSM